MTWLASVLLKPLVLFSYQLTVAFFDWAAQKFLAEGAIKRWLTKRY